MIQVFTELVSTGGGDPSQLSGGISQALITTAFGLGVAILALIGYRYFLRRVDHLIVHLEWQASRLVDAVGRRFRLASLKSEVPPAAKARRSPLKSRR